MLLPGLPNAVPGYPNVVETARSGQCSGNGATKGSFQASPTSQAHERRSRASQTSFQAAEMRFRALHANVVPGFPNIVEKNTFRPVLRQRGSLSAGPGLPHRPRLLNAVPELPKRCSRLHQLDSRLPKRCSRVSNRRRENASRPVPHPRQRLVLPWEGCFLHAAC